MSLFGVLVHAGPVTSPIYGIDLYRGHRAEASGVVPRRGDADAERWWLALDYLREASRAKQVQMTTEQGNAYWAKQALREGLAHPHAGLRRTGVKLLATLMGDPLPPAPSAPRSCSRQQKPWPLRISLWCGRILVPLGLVGIGLGLHGEAHGSWPACSAASATGAGAATAPWAVGDAGVVTPIFGMFGFGSSHEPIAERSARPRSGPLARRASRRRDSIRAAYPPGSHPATPGTGIRRPGLSAPDLGQVGRQCVCAGACIVRQTAVL